MVSTNDGLIAADKLTKTPAETRKTAAKMTKLKKYSFNKQYRLKPLDSKGNPKVVLLTFDDAPYTNVSTPAILKVLKRHQVKGLFFVNGYLVERAPSLLRAIHQDGHMIGNHTWGHLNLGEKSKYVIGQEVLKVQQAVKKMVGVTPRFFRPPYGIYNDKVEAILAEQKLQLLYWSNDSEDWHYRTKQSPKVVKSVLKQLKPGSIILLHDLPAPASVLDELLRKLNNKGYPSVDPQQM